MDGRCIAPEIEAIRDSVAVMLLSRPAPDLALRDEVAKALNHLEAARVIVRWVESQ